MRSKYQIYLIAAGLVILALSIMFYKIEFLGYSLSPETKRSLYEVEAKVSFEGTGKGAFVSLALPPDQDGFIRVNEDAASSDFGFVIANRHGTRRAEWSRREVTGKQTLYYTEEILPDPNYRAEKQPEPVINPAYEKLELGDLSGKVVEQLIREARTHSYDDVTFAAYLVKKFSNKTDQTISLIFHKYVKNDQDLQRAFAVILAKADIPFNMIEALKLGATKRVNRLIPMFEVYDARKKRWQLFDLHKGQIDRPADLYFWNRGPDAVLITENVKRPRVSFAVTETLVPARTATLKAQKAQESIWNGFSLFSLPIDSQNNFKRLLLVPIGALVVVLLRLFVGLKTSGTFMPVLLAMAFAETQLIPGIVMFLVVVGIGLLFRSYLAHLNLLLVARISAVLILVVGIMVYVAILSYRLGIQESVTITFFPMIILAWTIERMSIIWEEDGPREVLKQGGGSLIVAILAYFAMTAPMVGYLTYNFPETLLIILAIIIVAGRYSGYRLSELYRFASFAKRIDR